MNDLAVITGCPGMDARTLSRFLLDKHYDVVGIHRHSTTPHKDRFKEWEDILDHPNFTLRVCDITDASGIDRLIQEYQPDEFYNLAAMSFVKESFNTPVATMEIDGIGPVNIMEAIRNFSPHTRMYQASSSEMFGFCHDIDLEGKYQDEYTQMKPASPYGAAKLYAHNMINIYRKSYNLFFVSGILFNHFCPVKRGEHFVEKKIAKWFAEFINHSKGGQIVEYTENYIILDFRGREMAYPKLRLGNVYSYRDFTASIDMMRGAWMMLQQDNPKDYLLSSDRTYQIKDIIDRCAEYLDLSNPDKLWTVDPEFFRPAEVDYLRGRPYAARDELGWTPKVSFTQLIGSMVDFELKNTKNSISPASSAVRMRENMK